MRDLDNRDLVSGDFLVVSGDVVSNVNLGPALARHRARREKDKNAIMTVLLREAGPHHRLKGRKRRPVFVIDPKADRCLHYEEVGGKGGSRYVNLDSEFLTAHDEIEVREDLIDPYIDICTPDVLALWSENFDYQSLRKSFLFGVLKDYELNGKTIHTHIVTDQYAARVRGLRTYCAISKDILCRWTYPLCPDSNFMDGQTYRLRKGKVNQEDGVKAAHSSTIRGRCVLASGTKVGEHATITDSILGRGCQLGDNVLIENAYLWDNVIVEDQVTINGPAIIGAGARICTKASLAANALIAPGAIIKRETSISDVKLHKDKDDMRTTNIDADSDASSDASMGLTYQHPSGSSSQSSISTFASSDDGFQPTDTSRRSSLRSDRSEETAQNRDFQVEATTSILDGLTNGDAADTIFLELNSYRMSVDVSQHEVRQAVVTALLKRISVLSEGTSPREAVKQIFTGYKSLVERIILDKGKEAKTDQVDFLLLVQKDTLGRAGGGQLLLFVAKEMYDQDIIEEDGVLQWWEDPRSAEGEMGATRKLSEPFITYLKEAEEDEDSEEEEDEGEDESY